MIQQRRKDALYILPKSCWRAMFYRSFVISAAYFSQFRHSIKQDCCRICGFLPSTCFPLAPAASMAMDAKVLEVSYRGMIQESDLEEEFEEVVCSAGFNRIFMKEF